MRILFVGVLDVNWSTNVEMKRALIQLGHTVDDFNYRTIAKDVCPMWYRRRWLNFIPEKVTSFLRRYPGLPGVHQWYFRLGGRSEMNRRLLAAVKKEQYDLVLLSKTDSVDYMLLDQINQYAPTWYFFMDPMDQARRINAKEYARRATWASATFSDVNRHFAASQAETHWIMQGFDPEAFSPPAIAAQKTAHVVFVGSKTAKRNVLITHLRNQGITVSCYGLGWENGPVFLEDLVRIYRQAKIVLNACRTGAGFSVRVFQVMGTGAFLLSEYCPDLLVVFERGVHLDWFKNNDEAAALIARYLQNASLREDIARRGCQQVNQQHTWKHVMHRIMDIVENAPKPNNR